ncbi:MAG: transcriptional regulator [Rhodobacteraceae bacterium]|nr:transcriptional regulator [Paracoccaceae bacterium]
MIQGSIERDICPIGLAADLIGDKWSLIILRDISILSRQTFNQLLKQNLEGISSATLAKRLKRLMDIGLLTVSKDQTHSQKKLYCLTEPAIQFIPIIFNLAHWAESHHHPSQIFVKPIEAYLGDDKGLIDNFLKGLRQIHLEHKPIAEVDEIFLELAS